MAHSSPPPCSRLAILPSNGVAPGRRILWHEGLSGPQLATLVRRSTASVITSCAIIAPRNWMIRLRVRFGGNVGIDSCLVPTDVFCDLGCPCLDTTASRPKIHIRTNRTWRPTSQDFEERSLQVTPGRLISPHFQSILHDSVTPACHRGASALLAEKCLAGVLTLSRPTESSFKCRTSDGLRGAGF